MGARTGSGFVALVVLLLMGLGGNISKTVEHITTGDAWIGLKSIGRLSVIHMWR